MVHVLSTQKGRNKYVESFSKPKMLSNEQIVENLLSDSVSYGEFVREMLIGVMQSSANKRIYWDAWFRGAKGKKLEAADKGIIYKKQIL